MADIYRERERERERYYRDDSPEDDYRQTTVTRYKVPSKKGGASDYDRTTERVVEVDDTGRSHFSSSNRDHLDVGGGRDRDRDRGYPERPKSAFEPGFERDRYYERDVERDVWRGGEGDARSRVSGRDRDRDYYDDRRSRYDDEIRVERRSEDKYDDAHGHEVERIRKETEYYVPQENPAPIVIRQRAEPQKIILQEAAPAAPIVLARNREREDHRERESERQLARREPREEDYYYHRETRTVGPYRGDSRREDEWAMSRYDRGRDRRREEDDNEDYYVHRKKVVRRESSAGSEHHKRELAGGALAGAGITALLNSRRDEDGDLPAHRGKKVLAGAALGALGTEALKRARSAYGDRAPWSSSSRNGSPDDHSRLKKGLGIAAVALAAAGAAKYYQSNKVEKEESRRGRSRGRRRSHRSDYDRSISRESRVYSRSRTRTPSRSKSRKRSLSKAAAAVLGTAATAGIVKKLHDRSKSRQGRSASRGGKSRSRSRSKSKLRRVAEIGGVAATAGVASRMWKNHREKKEQDKEREREMSRGRGYDSDDSRYGRGRDRSFDSRRSRSRSLGRSHSRGPPRQLDMVEYGDGALPPARGYEDEAEERRRRRLRRRGSSISSSGSEVGEKKRSRSRGLRNLATAGAAAIGLREATKDRREERSRSRGPPRDERSRSRGPPRGARERSLSRSVSRGPAPRRRRDSYSDDEYYPNRNSPPTASGGAFYPPYPGTPGPAPPAAAAAGAAGAGAAAGASAPYAQFPPNPSNPNLHDPYGAPPGGYVPQDYMGYPPPTAPAPGQPPPGPPPPPSMVPGNPPPPQGGPNFPPQYVSLQQHNDFDDVVRDRNALRRPPFAPNGVALLRREGTSSTAVGGLLEPEGSVTSTPSRDDPADGLLKPEPFGVGMGMSGSPSHRGGGRGVQFIPLSPKSSMTMRRHHLGQIKVEEGGSDGGSDTDTTDRAPSNNSSSSSHQLVRRERRGSDPTDDRRLVRPRSRGAHHHSSADESSDIEELPSRFDANGQPLYGQDSTRRITTRRGDFHKRPVKEGDWDIRGAWEVAGSDGVVVDRLARSFTEALDGRKGWGKVLGEVGRGLLEGGKR